MRRLLESRKVAVLVGVLVAVLFAICIAAIIPRANPPAPPVLALGITVMPLLLIALASRVRPLSTTNIWKCSAMGSSDCSTSLDISPMFGIS